MYLNPDYKSNIPFTQVQLRKNIEKYMSFAGSLISKNVRIKKIDIDSIEFG